MDIPVVEKDGKKVFVGHEDPTNPPVFVKSPIRRYCATCHADSNNDKTACEKCGTQFDDNKMQCPTCHCWFDYLIGDDGDGGVRGCEAHWKPSIRKEAHEEKPAGEVFN